MLQQGEICLRHVWTLTLSREKLNVDMIKMGCIIYYTIRILKSGEIWETPWLLGVTLLWHVAQWVSLAPLHHTLPAFLNLNGILNHFYIPKRSKDFQETFSVYVIFTKISSISLINHLLLLINCAHSKNGVTILGNVTIWGVTIMSGHSFSFKCVIHVHACHH